MAQGEAALKLRQFLTALEAFKRANALRSKTSPEAYLGMSRASHGQTVFPEALKNADQALTYAHGNRRLQGAIRYQRALTLVAMAQSPDDPKLEEGEREFVAAGTLEGTLARPSYERGEALLTAYRDAEGLRELRAYVAAGGDASKVEAARRLMANPRLAREKFAAPEFSLTTSTGQTFSLTNLRGKVVLLDFWGSWCPPCRANTPALVELHRKYADQIVMIGVAVGERTPHIWRDYITGHKMTWHQYLESDGENLARRQDDGGRSRMSDAFKVLSVPTYIVLDREGIVRARLREWPDEGPVQLENAIRGALVFPARKAQP